MQTPDHRTGAYYVTIRSGTRRTILALGPFRRHGRALGLVATLRLRFMRANLDPWHAYSYGTSRAELRDGLEEGAFNETFNVAPDIRRPTAEPHVFGAAIYSALERA